MHRPSMIGDFPVLSARVVIVVTATCILKPGAIGQRLYVAAEAFGLAATGIGAFYDEEVHRYLNLTPNQGQVVYHFAIGYAVPDSRLSA